MNENAMKLERAWNLLRTIPVVDVHVDTMHEVRLLVADVHKNLSEAGCDHGKEVHE